MKGKQSTLWLQWSKHWQEILPRAGWGWWWGGRILPWGSISGSGGAGTWWGGPPPGPTCWSSSLPSSRQGVFCREKGSTNIMFNHTEVTPSSPDHEPAHVWEEEAPVGIVRVGLGLTALVVEPASDKPVSSKIPIYADQLVTCGLCSKCRRSFRLPLSWPPARRLWVPELPDQEIFRGLLQKMSASEIRGWEITRNMQ